MTSGTIICLIRRANEIILHSHLQIERLAEVHSTSIITIIIAILCHLNTQVRVILKAYFIGRKMCLGFYSKNTFHLFLSQIILSWPNE